MIVVGPVFESTVDIGHPNRRRGGSVPELSSDKPHGVRLALAEVFRDYGLAGLDSPAVLDTALPALLPDEPDEVAMLRTAAAHGVAARLSAQFAAGAGTDEAVRGVTDSLAGEGVDQWIITQYADVLGHPVEPRAADSPETVAVTAAPAVADTRPTELISADSSPTEKINTPAGGVLPAVPVQKGPRYAPGKATPYMPTNDYTQSDYGPRAFASASQHGLIPPPAPRPRRNYLPLIVGLVVIAVVGAGALAIFLTSSPSCRGASCTPRSQGHAHPSTAASKLPVTAGATLPPVVQSAPPAPSPSISGPVLAGPPVSLAKRLPADITVSTCLTTGNYGSFLNARTVAEYYSCTEAVGSTLPNMQVWGYQFTDRESYAAGVNDFNGFVNFNTATAAAVCPPAQGDGYATWWRGADGSATLGHVECYADQSGQPNYVWTDDVEFTIIVAAATTTQSFADLDKWWRANNRSGDGT
jgi:hypothetical protein